MPGFLPCASCYSAQESHKGALFLTHFPHLNGCAHIFFCVLPYLSRTVTGLYKHGVFVEWEKWTMHKVYGILPLTNGYSGCRYTIQSRASWGARSKAWAPPLLFLDTAGITLRHQRTRTVHGIYSPRTSKSRPFMWCTHLWAWKLTKVIQQIFSFYRSNDKMHILVSFLGQH